LYYGTEVGLGQPRAKGPHREEARHPMPWGEMQDADLLRYTKQLIEIRKHHPALVYGDTTTHLLDDERKLWLAECTDGEDSVWVALNAGTIAQSLPLPAAPFTDLLSDEQLHDHCTLPAYSLRFLSTGESPAAESPPE